MYLSAGPLNDLFPTSGETATTFFLFLVNSFLTPLIPIIGPILVSGFPGAITTSSAS